jgi:hypothetical protein
LAQWCNGAGRGALDVAQRPVPLHSGNAEFGEDGRRQIAERAVRPDSVVIVLPECQHLADMGERGEDAAFENDTLDRNTLRPVTIGGNFGDVPGLGGRGCNGATLMGRRFGVSGLQRSELTNLAWQRLNVRIAPKETEF